MSIVEPSAPDPIRRTPTPIRRSAVAALLVLLWATGCTAVTPSGGTLQPSATAGSPGDTTVSPPAAPEIVTDLSNAPWTRAIERVVDGQNVSVAVGEGDRLVFAHDASILRMPASNEKLLTSMAALDTFGAGHRFPTLAEAAASPTDGVLRGDLWIVGSGDPELTDARLAALASELHATGLRRITGAVVGDTSEFDRGWWAPGWLPGISRSFVTRPTALALDGNVVSGLPEGAAAASLTRALVRAGVRVDGGPRAGSAPGDLKKIAVVRSAPLRDILARQNHGSINFDAEMITKALGAADGSRGSTASGARAVETWAEVFGVTAEVRDGSGLSHLDRISTAGVVTLLLEAGLRPWAEVLYESLPAPGEGTLVGRLIGVPVRAKTGTLFITPASALSGYVRAANGRRLAFSVISRGLDKATAVRIEDSIVRILAATRSR